jgi:hypothetical protein
MYFSFSAAYGGGLPEGGAGAIGEAARAGEGEGDGAGAAATAMEEAITVRGRAMRMSVILLVVEL